MIMYSRKIGEELESRYITLIIFTVFMPVITWFAIVATNINKFEFITNGFESFSNGIESIGHMLVRKI